MQSEINFSHFLNEVIDGGPNDGDGASEYLEEHEYRALVDFLASYRDAKAKADSAFGTPELELATTA